MSYTIGDFNVYSDLLIGGDIKVFSQSNTIVLGAGDLFVNGSINAVGDILPFSRASNLTVTGSLYASGNATAFASPMPYPSYDKSQTPIVPLGGVISLCNIACAFPGMPDSHHLLAFKNAHPTVSSAPQMSMNILRGLTALSPTFDFANVPTLGSNVVVTCQIPRSASHPRRFPRAYLHKPRWTSTSTPSSSSIKALRRRIHCRSRYRIHRRFRWASE